ncbi:MOSC domain-containing protein [Cohnella sp.]|uniref:MOSC domain-containing protein n=1 Tax=Cohnella sp. TaxID=1883426 RepID=UPI003568C5D5
MGQNISPSAYPLLAVNIGSVQAGIYKGKETRSGIGKSAVDHSVMLTELGLVGDEQADLVHHGGIDKAICVYNFNHYSHWEKILKRPLVYGTFGENFTVHHLYENEVHIGNIFDIGNAVVQVSQPRQPCWKLAMKWGLDELPLLVTDSGATGFYFRVLRSGEVKAGDQLQLKETHPAQITIAEANRVMHKDREDINGIRRLLEVEELSASWVNTLTSRLKRLID